MEENKQDRNSLFSEVNWTWSWETCSRRPCSVQGGLD